MLDERYRFARVVGDVRRNGDGIVEREVQVVRSGNQQPVHVAVHEVGQAEHQRHAAEVAVLGDRRDHLAPIRLRQAQGLPHLRGRRTHAGQHEREQALVAQVGLQPMDVEQLVDWLVRYREAQRARIARLDTIARASIEGARDAWRAGKEVDAGKDPERWRRLRARAVHTKYMVIYRTLADPAYLDLSIDPDDRPMGSLFAFPDPLDANYGRGGLARTMTARGWLSTWSGLSSHAKLADTMPQVKVPTLILHPTADTEIRVRQALAIRDAAGSEDVTYHELRGAPHYLEGHRPAAMELCVDWLRARFP